MLKYCFDIETRNLNLDDTNIIWCLIIQNIDTKEILIYKTDEIKQALLELSKADLLVGHNIIDFDLEVLKALHDFSWKGKKIWDTLITARLVWPDINKAQNKGHKLEDWGERLGLPKIQFSAFDQLSDEMITYCQRDVELTSRLYQTQQALNYSQRAIDIEHKFAKTCSDMMRNGVGINIEKTKEVLVDLSNTKQEAHNAIKKFLPNKLKTGHIRDQEKKGRLIEKLEHGYTYQLRGQTAFKLYEYEEPSVTRSQIILAMIARGWKPMFKTETGGVALNKNALAALNDESAEYYPLAALVKQYYDLEKKIGFLDEKNESGWLGLIDKQTSRLHCFLNHNGAVTGRCTSNRPNLQQIPKDNRFRNLVQAAPGNILVSSDAVGLEVKILGHFLWPLDKGRFAAMASKPKAEFDIHAANAHLFGVSSRDVAKQLIYAITYGAGCRKIGEGSYKILGHSATDVAKIGSQAFDRSEIKLIIEKEFLNKEWDKEPSDFDIGCYVIGKPLRDSIKENLPEVELLKQKLKWQIKTDQNYNYEYYTNKYILSLTGRKLWVREDYSALNTLIQGTGADIIKLAIINFYIDACKEIGYNKGWKMILQIHDEYIVECSAELEDKVKRIMLESYKKAEKQLNLRVSLEGEVHSGVVWSK